MPLSERALYWLDKYLTEARPQLCDDPQQPLLFVSTTGNPLHPNDISSRVRRLMNRAGITKKGSCHLFRHTVATMMLDGGADVRHIQELLGHRNLGTTQIYTHVSIGKLCEVHARTHPARLFRRGPSKRDFRQATPLRSTALARLAVDHALARPLTTYGRVTHC